MRSAAAMCRRGGSPAVVALGRGRRPSAAGAISLGWLAGCVDDVPWLVAGGGDVSAVRCSGGDDAAWTTGGGEVSAARCSGGDDAACLVGGGEVSAARSSGSDDAAWPVADDGDDAAGPVDGGEVLAGRLVEDGDDAAWPVAGAGDAAWLVAGAGDAAWSVADGGAEAGWPVVVGSGEVVARLGAVVARGGGNVSPVRLGAIEGSGAAPPPGGMVAWRLVAAAGCEPGRVWVLVRG